MDKLRPYRVDYFAVDEMKDDKALVRSVVVRAVTAQDAANMVWPDNVWFIIIIRAYRFYKKLAKRRDVYKAVKDLFSANEAARITALIADYRRKEIDRQFEQMATDEHYQKAVKELCEQTVGTPEPAKGTYGYTEYDAETGAMTAHVCDLHPAKVPTWGGGLKIPIPQPTTGPDSPATKAALAVLPGQGPDYADKNAALCGTHEIGSRGNYADPSLADLGDDISAALAAAEFPDHAVAPTKAAVFDDSEMLGCIHSVPTPGCLRCEAKKPEWTAPPPANVPFPGNGTLPLWVKVLMFGGVAIVAVFLVIAMRRPC